jgi:hypothetical protein
MKIQSGIDEEPLFEIGNSPRKRLDVSGLQSVTGSTARTLLAANQELRT